MSTISQIGIRGVSEERAAELRNALPIHEGNELSDDLLRQSLEAVKTIDAGLKVAVRRLRDGQSVHITIFDPTKPPERVRVEHLLTIPPQKAAESGTVQVDTLIGKDGIALEARAIAGPETLQQPAVQAVRQWQFRPPALNGRPVELSITVEVKFELISAGR